MEVKPIFYESLKPAQKNYFDKLSDFNPEFLKEKLFLEGKFTDEAKYEEAFTEFKKYTALIRLTNEPLGMTSVPIDTVWHQYILFTREYAKYCNEFRGKFMHHTPNLPSSPHSPEPTQNLIKYYKKTFGEMPKIWFEREL